MKKVAVALVVLLAISGIVFILHNNKAKSEAKLKSVTVKPYAVTVVPVSRQEISDSLSLIGTVAPYREVSVASETQGRILSISAEVGSYKGRGSVIARVDDELKRTAVSMAQVNYEKAKKDLERYQMVQVENMLPEQQIDNAQLAVKAAQIQLTTVRRQLRDTRITSPIAGVVSVRSAEVGTMVQPGMVIANIIDISRLKVKLNVPEEEVFSMQVGERIEVTTDVYPGVTFYGNISTIGTKGDDAHTYPVEITLPNNNANPLKAGMFARVKFMSRGSRSLLVIPRTAVVGSVKRPQVYVVNSGKAYLRDIMVGSEAGTSIEVLKGLVIGDQVVVGGQNNLRDSMQVEVMK